MTSALPATCPTCGAPWEYAGPAGRECANHHCFLIEDLVDVAMEVELPATLAPAAPADPRWPTPAQDGHPAGLATLDNLGHLGHLRSARLVRLADVTPTPVVWLWRGYLPLGKLIVLDGDPGLGKSAVTLDLAARVSTGLPLPDGSDSDLAGPGGVVLLSAEDGLADTIRPRLEAAGADVARIVALTGVAEISLPQGQIAVRLPTIADLPSLKEAISRVAARLVIIDPLMAFLADDVQSNHDQSIRRALAPLTELADRARVAILVVRHLNKSGGGHALYRGGGSIGIVGAARTGLLIAPDPDDPSRRILASPKSNLAAAPPALAYRLEEAPNGAVRVVWLGPTAHTADQLLASAAADAEDHGAHQEAVAFLQELLAAGPVAAQEVQAAARAAGITERTLRRAKGAADVQSAHRGAAGPHGVWEWFLPAKVAKPDQDGQPQKVATLVDGGHLGPGLDRPGPSDPCVVCGALNWRPLGIGWLCATCFPLGRGA